MNTKIEVINLRDYEEMSSNPRLDLKPGDTEYTKLEKSIDTFGFIVLPVVNKRTKRIIAGHMRIRVLREKGITEVEAVVVDFDETMEKAANLALNRIGEGNWDKEKLCQFLNDLSGMPDFDMSLTGFDSPEICQIMDQYIQNKDPDDFDFQAELDSIEEPVAKPGELIELGDHRILCGNSADPNDIKRLMNGERARLWYTDPPYNVRYTNTRPVGQKKQSKWKKIYKDDLSQEDYEKWFEQVIINVKDYIEPCSPVYIWNGHAQFGPMHLMLTKHGFHVGTVIVWAKEHFSISFADFNQAVEFCLYSWKKGEGKHFWYGPTNESTLWEVRRDPAKSLIHPTQKPVELSQRALRNSSQRGDIVLETFLGSGSALISSTILGRRCYGCEIDPAYVTAICRRYIAFVGKDKVSSDIVKRYLKEK